MRNEISMGAAQSAFFAKGGLVPAALAPRRRGARRAAALLALSTAMVAGLGARPGYAANRFWDGDDAATSTLWSDAINWDGNVSAPASTDQIYFNGVVGLTNTNNLGNSVQFNALTFGSGAGAFVLGTSDTTVASNLGGNIFSNSTSNEAINFNLALTGNRTVNTIGGNVTIGGNISGGFGLTKAWGNTLTLAGTNNRFTGATTVSGVLSLGTTGQLYVGQTAGSLALNNGEFSMTGTSAAARAQTFGALQQTVNTTNSLGGLDKITLVADPAQPLTLTFASLGNRGLGSTILYKGTNLGVNAPSTNGSTNILFTTAPAVVSTGAPFTVANINSLDGTAATPTLGATSAPVLRGALVDNGSAIGFGTYDPAVGVRLLNPSTEQLAVSDDSSYQAATTDMNVRFNSTVAAPNNTIGITGKSHNTVQFDNTSGGLMTVTNTGVALFPAHGLLFSGDSPITLTGGGMTLMNGAAAADMVVLSANTSAAGVAINTTMSATGSGQSSWTFGGPGNFTINQNPAPSSTGGLYINGPGTVTLNMNNYAQSAQGLVVSGGKVILGSNFQLTSSSRPLVIAPGATVDLNNYTVASTNVVGIDELLDSGGGGVVTNSGTQNVNLALSYISKGGATFSGVISGNLNLVITKQSGSGTPTQTLTNTSTYTGSTIITSNTSGTTATLILGSGGQIAGEGAGGHLPSTTNVTLGGGFITDAAGVVTGTGQVTTGNGRLQLGDATAAINQTIASLASAGTGTDSGVIGGSAVATGLSTLTINGSASTTFGGFLGLTSAANMNLAIVRAGIGSTTLMGTGNTYTGGTAVNGGGLFINTTGSGSMLGTGNVAVSGGTLGGTGAIAGTVTVSSGAHLSPGLASVNGGVGTLTLSSNLTLGSGSNVDLDFNSNALPNDVISVLGSLTLGASVNLNVFAAGTATPFNGTGDYTIFTSIDSTKLTGDPASAFHVIGDAAAAYSITAVPTSGTLENLVLHVAGVVSANTWLGTAGNAWNVNTNWSANVVPNGAGASVLLGSNSINNTVDLATTDERVGAVTIDNGTNSSYSITSSGGKLILDNGGGNATIRVLGGSATISAPVILNAIAAITVQNAGTILTIDNVIDDGGAILGFTMNGAGSLLLTKTNTYSGATAISAASTLQIGNGTGPASLGFGAVTNGGNFIVDNGGSSAGATNNGTMTLNAGGSVNGVTNTKTFIYNDGTFSGAVNNSGLITLNKNGAYNLGVTLGGAGTLTQAAANAVVTVTASSSGTGQTNINAGSVTLGPGASLGTGGVSIAAGGKLNLNGNSATMATLSGAGVVDNINAAPVTLTLREPSGASSWGGIIQNSSGQVSVVIGGASQTSVGTITLNAANTYTGKTIFSNGTVSGGELILGVNDAISPSSEIDIQSTNTAKPLVLGVGGVGVTLNSNVVLQNNQTGNGDFIGVPANTASVFAGNVTNTNAFGASPQDVVNASVRLGPGSSGSLTITGNIQGNATAGPGPGGLASTVVLFTGGNSGKTLFNGATVNSFSSEFVLGRSSSASNFDISNNSSFTSNVTNGGEGGSLGGDAGNTAAIVVTSANSSINVGAGTFGLNSGAAGSATTLSLNGGSTLTASGFTKTSAGATTLNWNGGTVVASASNAAFLPAAAALTVNVGAGGARIDSNGFNVTVAAPLSGAAGDGGLTKLGLGTLTLAANLKLTGAANVTGGKLAVTADGATHSAVALDLGNITATGGGKLDLQDRDAIVRNPGGNVSDDTAVTTIGNLIHSGLTGGSGIMSSVALAAGNTTLGFGYAADFGISTFDGVSVSPADILIRYVGKGDLNFDGQTDAADLDKIFSLLGGLYDGPYFGQGDLNGDGQVDAADLDQVFQDLGNLVGGDYHPLGGSVSLSDLGLASVPEPASLMLLGLGGAALLTRRRRK